MHLERLRRKLDLSKLYVVGIGPGSYENMTQRAQEALKKAIKKCVMMLVILAVIGLLPTLIRVIGLIAGFDLSCL